MTFQMHLQKLKSVQHIFVKVSSITSWPNFANYQVRMITTQKKGWPSVVKKPQIFGKTFQRLKNSVSFWAKTLCCEKYYFWTKINLWEKIKSKKLYSLWISGFKARYSTVYSSVIQLTGQRLKSLLQNCQCYFRVSIWYKNFVWEKIPTSAP